jgi:hypothetical protein
VTAQENDDMAIPIIQLRTSFPELDLRLPDDAIRRRALERLYERRAAVLSLIQALESYQQSHPPTSFAP